MFRLIASLIIVAAVLGAAIVMNENQPSSSSRSQSTEGSIYIK